MMRTIRTWRRSCAICSGRNRTSGSSSSSTPTAGRARGPPEPRGSALPFSAQAQANARRGIKTFETITHDREEVRILTMPIVETGASSGSSRSARSLGRAQGVLRRYLETLLVLIPLGVGLAAAGGAVIARKALRPVDEMTAAARRITAEDLHQRIGAAGHQDELDRLAETLNGMLARLDEAFRQMRRFAADAAHELRTPLTALKGGIEVALRASRTPEEYRQVLGSSLEDVDRLIRVAEDLLLSRAAARDRRCRGPASSSSPRPGSARAWAPGSPRAPACT